MRTLLPNVTDNKYISVNSVVLMLMELKVQHYTLMEDKNKFLDAFIIEGDKADYNLLQACLNVYRRRSETRRARRTPSRASSCRPSSRT